MATGWQVLGTRRGEKPTLTSSAQKPYGSYPERMQLRFNGEIWFWKGPSPFHFVTVPEEQSAAIESVSALVSYGWGVIPVAARIGGTDWTTSLFPKDGGYVLPLKDAVRRSERLALGDNVAVRLEIAT